MTMMIDPRPMDPPADWDVDYTDPAIFWVINYHPYDKEQKKIVHRTDRGSSIRELLDTLINNLKEGIECDGYIESSESGPPIDLEPNQLYCWNIPLPDYTGMFWRIYDPGDETNFDQHEDGTDNGDFITIAERYIHGRHNFKFDISAYDPTP